MLHPRHLPLLLLMAAVAPARAQSTPSSPIALNHSQQSYYSDQCNGPCACPTVLFRMSGRAILTHSHSNPLFDYYTLTPLDWRAQGFAATRMISGAGTYQIGGEVALTQRLTMDVLIDGVAHHLDSGVVVLGAAFPDIRITVEDTPHTSVCNYVVLQLDLIAACSIADVAGVGGTTPDGRLTADDIVVYLSHFFASDTAVADITGLGGGSPPDGQATVDDLVAFLAAFFGGGCL